MPLGKLRFSENFIYLERRRISFAGRPYLPPIYAAHRGNLVIRASRQVEKSTLLANTIIYEACINTDARIIYVAPRFEQARTFSHERLTPLLTDSPAIRRLLLGRGHRLRVTDFEFSNGARLYIRHAFHSADACRGLSANMLLVDEFQDLADDLPVLEACLSHAARPRTIITGTPKLIDNALERVFNRSTANSWTMSCSRCQTGVTIDERCLGPTGLVCPTCQSLLDASQGSWVPRNPDSTWGQGFSICHPMTPWLIDRYEETLRRQSEYGPVRFRNEVLGLPVELGDHVVTRAEMEACCGGEPMLHHGDFVGLGRRVRLFAGIDWSGGTNSRTAVVLVIMRDDYACEIKQITVLQPREDPNRVLEEVARICNHYQVSAIAADGNGNGHTYNRMLYGRLRHSCLFYSIIYSAEQRPSADGCLWRWLVDRSRSIGALFARVKLRQLVFPCRLDSDPFLDEFACQIAEYDEHRRAIEYIRPETQFDDVLHATNYALLVASRDFNAARAG
jgi:hypothetical protein